MEPYGSARCKPGSADEDAEAAPRPLAAWLRGEAGLTEEVSPRARRRMPPASHRPPSDQCRNAVHGATTSVRRTPQYENPSQALNKFYPASRARAITASASAATARSRA